MTGHILLDTVGLNLNIFCISLQYGPKLLKSKVLVRTNHVSVFLLSSIFIVMNDIVGTMFSKNFMDELLKPQQLYSHRTMKTVLTRLAHTSIMRLNPASMDRVCTA